MACCEYCGQSLDSNEKYCPYCGAPIPEAAANGAGTGGYSVILTSLGTCELNNAAELLEDMLGYRVSQIESLLNSLPAAAAKNLTKEQAVYIAQAMTEYGLEVSVWDGNGYVDIGSSATESVFDSDGSFTAKALGVLAGIGAANRLSRFFRWSRNDYHSHLFVPAFRAPAPPVHRRRSLFQTLFGRHKDVRPRPAPSGNPGRMPDRGPYGSRSSRSYGSRGPAGGASRGPGHGPGGGFGVGPGRGSGGGSGRGPGGGSGRGPGGPGRR